MKISHIRKSLNSKPFDTVEDLAEVAEIVRNIYDPTACNCKLVCELLSEKYSNLTPVLVNTMIFNGTVQKGGHVVCKVEDSDMILDPTGDYAEYSNTARLKHTITPWLYRKYDNMYLSQNHLPMQFSESEMDSEEPFSEVDILRLSSGPFYIGLRSITI